MYERLKQLPVDRQLLMQKLKPVVSESLHIVNSAIGSHLSEYQQFLLEVGAGQIREPDEPDNYPPHLELWPELRDAERDYFGDARFKMGGAKGDVSLFGCDSSGTAFGFDLGGGGSLIEIDSSGTCRNLSLSFEQFVTGVFVCFPDIPVQYFEGVWKEPSGDEYTWPILE